MLISFIAQRELKILWLVIFLGVFLGCGRKAPPKPPQQLQQLSVNDLSKSLNEGRLTLTWTIPNVENNRQADLAGFMVYKSRKKLSDADCQTCPVFFERVADIPLNQVTSKDFEKKTMFYMDTIEEGYHYLYKVVVYSINGVMGTDSNIIEFVY